MKRELQGSSKCSSTKGRIDTTHILDAMSAYPRLRYLRSVVISFSSIPSCSHASTYAQACTSQASTSPLFSLTQVYCQAPTPASNVTGSNPTQPLTFPSGTSASLNPTIFANTW